MGASLADERRHPLFHPLCLIGLFCLCTLLVRAQILGSPVIHVDEQFYLLVGDKMLHGALPYVDIWDRKPIGLFLVYALARLFGGGGIWQYQALAGSSVVLTAFLINRITSRIASAPAAIVAGLTYIVWLNLADGAGGQAPIFYNLPMAGAALVVINALESPTMTSAHLRLRGGLAMLFVGVAIQIKYTAVFEGVLFVLALLWASRRSRGGVLAAGAIWVACALLPTILAIGAYALSGHLQAFVFANFSSITLRAKSPPIEIAWRLLRLVAVVSPLLVCAAVAKRQGQSESERLVARFVQSWLGTAIAGVLAFGTYFSHYALPLFVPGAIMAARLFDGPGRSRLMLCSLLGVAIIAGQALLVDVRARNGNGNGLERMVQAMHGHPGCLFVYSGHPMLYYMSHRCTVTRYIFPFHLSRSNEADALGVNANRETSRILAQKPGLIAIMSPPRTKESAASRPLVEDELAHHYELIYSEKTGHRTRMLYARRTP